MKLLIIVLCLLSERYLPHALSLHRFSWFHNYFASINNASAATHPLLKIVIAVLPLLFALWVILFFLGGLLFGLVGFVIQLLVFYYCLGPHNAFYPLREPDETNPNAQASHYLVAVQNQLFAPIFWFILLGPIALLIYRLLTLLQNEESVKKAAQMLVQYLDWVTVRITLILYLFAGNFLKGFRYFSTQWLTSKENNDEFLVQGSLLSCSEQDEHEIITLTTAQALVERALIIFLVFIAIFTIAAWT